MLSWQCACCWSQIRINIHASTCSIIRCEKSHHIIPGFVTQPCTCCILSQDSQLLPCINWTQHHANNRMLIVVLPLLRNNSTFTTLPRPLQTSLRSVTLGQGINTGLSNWILCESVSTSSLGIKFRVFSLVCLRFSRHVGVTWCEHHGKTSPWGRGQSIHHQVVWCVFELEHKLELTHSDWLWPNIWNRIWPVWKAILNVTILGSLTSWRK